MHGNPEETCIVKSIIVLFIGDIVGKAGRLAVGSLVRDIRVEHHLDLIIANGENAAGGMGITPDIARELFSTGIDILTSGNHIWQKKEIIEYLQQEKKLLRPLNFPSDTPGYGSCLVKTSAGYSVAVVNLLGRVFMDTYSCPFRAIEQEIERLHPFTRNIIVDFHAEATSEKIALGWYVDGKVSAVLGTHTHVQTADERILPQGTAYITDVGMTGSMDGVIGVKKELALQKFLTYLPVRFETSVSNPQLNGVMVRIDPQNGRAIEIHRIQRKLPSSE